MTSVVIDGVEIKVEKVIDIDITMNWEIDPDANSIDDIIAFVNRELHRMGAKQRVKDTRLPENVIPMKHLSRVR